MFFHKILIDTGQLCIYGGPAFSNLFSNFILLLLPGRALV